MKSDLSFVKNNLTPTPPKKHFFSFNKRCDGVRVKHSTSMQRILPFIFRTRTESLIYSPESMDFTAAREYIKRKNRETPGLGLSSFHLVIAALVRTIAAYPYLNRFISGKKLYARNYISFSFVVLKMVDGKTDETHAKIYLQPEDTLRDVMSKAKDTIDYCRANGEKNDDKLMDFVAKLPSPMISLIVFLVRKLNDWGLLPKSFIETDPLFTSAFITNLGSIGHGALNHHLYEWGNASLFVTMGRLTKEKIKEATHKDEEKWNLDMAITIDERIAYGYYLVKGIKYFQYLLNHPEKLELPPDEVVLDDCI